MRRILTEEHLAALGAGEVVELDGVELVLKDNSPAAIRRTVASGRPHERAVAAFDQPLDDASRWPYGARLVGYIPRHPRDEHAEQFAVVQMTDGREMAWNGHRFRELPTNWRVLVPLSRSRKK